MPEKVPCPRCTSDLAEFSGIFLGALTNHGSGIQECDVCDGDKTLPDGSSCQTCGGVYNLPQVRRRRSR
jgi:hypothetical protein